MEDEVQLQSLAKRLINIYNACKWSKTKLHLRKKKRISRNIQDNQHFEEYTEVETESSARTVFAYNRNYRNKTEKHIQILQSAVVERYSDERKSEIRNRLTENIQEPYYNDQSINVCTCKKCCCEPGKFVRKHESVDTRKNFEEKKKSNTKLIICLKPTDKQEASASTKNVGRGCCCPVCAQQNYGPQPMKNKSNIKTPKTPPTSNRDSMSQYVPPMTERQSPTTSLPSPSTSEPFRPHYPPASPPPSKPSKATKETHCPGSASKKKCCECPPTPSNASFCCQCTPPKSMDSLCCKCQPSPTYSPGCCKCPPSPHKTSDCCQCIPPPSSSFGCQYLHPSPASLCCCDFKELPSEDIRCCCRSEDTNNATIVCTDKIIIPTCYFNEGEQRSPSGNLSFTVSEEVKTVFLDGNSSEQRKYDTSDKQINTSCVIVRSCTPSIKREQHEALTKPVQVAIPPKVSPIPPKASPIHPRVSPIPQKASPIPQKASPIPKSIKDCNYRNCQCHLKEVKELNDQMINTSCVVVRSCTPSNKKSETPGHLATNILERQCGGACCKCQHNGQNDHSPSPPMQPEQHIQPLAHSPSPPMHPEHHVHPHNPLVDSPSYPMQAEQHVHPHHSLVHSPSPPMHKEQHVHPHNPLVHSPSPPMHQEQHVQPHIPLVQSQSPHMHPKQHVHPHNPATPPIDPGVVHNHSPATHPGHNAHAPGSLLHSASPPIHLGQYAHPYSSQIHSPIPPVHPRHNEYPLHHLVHSASPPIDLGHYAHSQEHSPRDPMHTGNHHDPSIHPAITGTQILRYPSERNFEPSLEAGRPPYDRSVNHSSGEERMIAKHSPQPFSDQMYSSYGGHMAQPSPNQNQLSPVHTNKSAGQPLYGGMVPPRQTDFTASLLRSQSTPLCCKQVPKGGGDEKIAGINDDTEAEIYATLQKIEFTLRDEADSHSRNMRCIVDQVCKQAGEIKELKVLVTGVVEDKRTPSCKQVEKKIKKLEKRKERSAADKRGFDLRERERRKKEGKRVEEGSLQEIASNLCCKCGEKKKKIRKMGCCGECCAKRCRGCCGTCCKGCFPKCCNCCCAPCEKCCPSCCCGLAKCCDTCWSCGCCPRRKRKCQCSK